MRVESRWRGHQSAGNKKCIRSRGEFGMGLLRVTQRLRRLGVKGVGQHQLLDFAENAPNRWVRRVELCIVHHRNTMIAFKSNFTKTRGNKNLMRRAFGLVARTKVQPRRCGGPARPPRAPRTEKLEEEGQYGWWPALDGEQYRSKLQTVSVSSPTPKVKKEREKERKKGRRHVYTHICMQTCVAFKVLHANLWCF